MLPIRLILCPTDFSAQSLLALEAAVELAHHFRSELVLVHVIVPSIESSVIPGAIMASNIPKPAELPVATNESLDKIRRERIPDDIVVRECVLEGAAADEISRKAGEEDADLIVMGTHGLTGWRHLVFGSVAEKVVRLSTCPVMTVPDAEKNSLVLFPSTIQTEAEALSS
ncbi:MAG: universal stress protein [Candidatus Vecturithrix sp.]|nr:universal stress protein [Candidatus Vecturithrix sp.]